jgi:hypothetical protein
VRQVYIRNRTNPRPVGDLPSNEIHVLSADVRLDARGEDKFCLWFVSSNAYRTGSNTTTRYGLPRKYRLVRRAL